MAFRIKTSTCIIVCATALLSAQDLTFRARHEHLRKGGEGTLAFSAAGVSWDEAGKKSGHSRTWKYEDIQRLELDPERVRITTYDDVRWQLGRDRVYVFDNAPEDMATRLYPFLAGRLDQRFVAHVGVGKPAGGNYETGAKLMHGTHGANGMLSIADDAIVFLAGGRGESRTWRFADLTSVSSAGPFELTVNTVEGENRFQLKQRLPEGRYQDLWLRISEVNGLKLYRSQMETHHENH